jgi:hypothetical protein
MLAGSILVLAASLFASAALLRPAQGGAEWWPFAVSLLVAVLGLALVVIGLLEDRPR